MHAILGRGSVCMNYCISAAGHGGDQPVAFLRCNGSPGCFDSSLQAIWIVGSGVPHLPLDISHKFSMAFKSDKLADHSSTVTWSLVKLALAVWEVPRPAG
ncbi:hypothetical protein CHARACLAT_016014 [Characodon lateralis]|uniref:Uncharacterized protein n=1 Tax=Characodon lateralis TaxID=208331 RepID=A0ABU7EA96_9TELE|nr:hypothetical protein [Characodon lateralis]